MKTKIFLTFSTSLAVALALSASGSRLDSEYKYIGSSIQNLDTIDDKKTDADSLPIPAPGQNPGKLDSTPFPQEAPRPVDPTPTPRPNDPPVSQPVKPNTSEATVGP